MVPVVARKLHYPAIMLGALLLLLAVVIAMRLDTTADHSLIEQRTAVVETVSHLENGCLTCHQSTVAHSLVTEVSYSIERRSFTHPETHSSSLQAGIDSQLGNLGQRVLALPITGQKLALGAFLTTYQQTRQVTSENVSASLSLIDSLKVMLRDLENQTNPNQIRRAESKPFQSSLSAAVVVPSGVSTALAYQVVPLGIVVLGRWMLVHDAYEFVMPREIVFAVHRRGPPSDSVLFHRVGWETAIL